MIKKDGVKPSFLLCSMLRQHIAGGIGGEAPEVSPSPLGRGRGGGSFK